MKPLLLFLLLSTAAWGQNPATISKSETVQQDTIPALYYNTKTGQYAFAEDTARLIVKRYDTIQVWLQYRLPSGQFGIVKGLEVIKRGEKIEVCNMPGCTVYHGDIFDKAREAQDMHIAYLRSNRRRFPKGTLIWKLQEPVKQ